MLDRYVVRPTDSPDRWCVWDTHHNAVVFGAKSLTEPQAKDMTQRLNEQWRAATDQSLIHFHVVMEQSNRRGRGKLPSGGAARQQCQMLRMEQSSGQRASLTKSGDRVSI